MRHGPSVRGACPRSIRERAGALHGSSDVDMKPVGEKRMQEALVAHHLTIEELVTAYTSARRSLERPTPCLSRLAKECLGIDEDGSDKLVATLDSSPASARARGLGDRACSDSHYRRHRYVQLQARRERHGDVSRFQCRTPTPARVAAPRSRVRSSDAAPRSDSRDQRHLYALRCNHSQRALLARSTPAASLWTLSCSTSRWRSSRSARCHRQRWQQ